MERWPRRRSGSVGRRALERRGRETTGSLEQRKRSALWEGRRPPGPGLERPNTLGARTVKPDGIAPRDGQAVGLPWRTDVEGGVAVFTDTRPLTAGRPAAVLHVAAGSYSGASDDGPFSLRLNGASTLGAGVPESAEFCDGPGPGMALEQNSFPAATPPGQG